MPGSPLRNTREPAPVSGGLRHAGPRKVIRPLPSFTISRFLIDPTVGTFRTHLEITRRQQIMNRTTPKRYCGRLKLVWPLLGFLLLMRPLAASTVRVYVNFEGLESFSDTGRPVTSDIIVIDPVTQKVVQTIKGIATPHGVTSSPDGRWVYI